MNLIGHWLTIKCFKHDGQPHRVWDRGLVLENNDDYIVVATKRAKVVEANGRRWFTKEPAVTIFSKKEWWNTICMIKKNGIVYYCNIASPYAIDENTIKYIDYDLDLRVFPDGSFRVLDRNEYNYHKKLMKYPNEIQEIIKYELTALIDMKRAGVNPFNKETIDYYNKIYQKIGKE